jgi:hypothetical protein
VKSATEISDDWRLKMLTCPSCGNQTFIQPTAFIMNENGELSNKVQNSPIRCVGCLTPVSLVDEKLMVLGRGL